MTIDENMKWARTILQLDQSTEPLIREVFEKNPKAGPLEIMEVVKKHNIQPRRTNLNLLLKDALSLLR